MLLLGPIPGTPPMAGDGAADVRGAVRSHAIEERGKEGPACVFAFGSSGWLFIWYLGVIKCMKEHRLHENCYCVGSSGGAITGGTLFCDVIGGIDSLARYVLTCASEARGSLFGNFRLRKFVRVAIETHVNKEAPRCMTGRMEVSVTRITMGGLINHRIKKLDTWDRMMQAMLASSCLVPLAGLPMHLGELGYCFDGGLTDFNPIGGWRTFGTFSAVHHVVPYARRRGNEAETNAPCTVTNDNTMLVRACPFYMSRAHILPDEFVPPWWAIFPPAPEKLWELYHMGYCNAAKWLRDARRDGNTKLPPLSEHAAQTLRAHEERTSSSTTTTGGLRRSNSQWELIHDEVAPEPGSTAGDVRRFFARLLSLQLVFFELFLHALCAIAALLLPFLRGIGPDGLPQTGKEVLSRLRTYVQSLAVVALAQLPGYHRWAKRRDPAAVAAPSRAAAAAPAPEPMGSGGEQLAVDEQGFWNLRQLSLVYRLLRPVVKGA